MTEVTPSSYWIASNALYITLNANGDPDYIVGNATSGAQILVYMKGINGLEYDAGHNYRRWPLSLSPTYFGTRTAKYVYVAVPRPGNPVGIATVVFPSEHIDIYGKNEQEEQIGSEDFYYIFLQGIISATNAGSTEPRTWQQAVETGTLSSDEALDAGGDNTWWKISTVDDTVHFLKEIVMDAKSFFQNFRLNGHEFVSEAKPGITPLDSENTIVTPLFGNRHYISKDHDDETQGEIGFLKGLWIKAKNLFGIGESGDALFRNLHLAENADIDGVLRSWAGVFANLLQSSNWTGDGHFDTGFRLMKDATGVTSMVVDNLFVRMKAIFTELEIRKISYAGGNIIFSHAGGKIVALAGVTYIRGEAHVIGHTIYLDDAEVVGHKVILPDGAGEFAYRCYMLADDGTTRTQNWWQVDDQARCQTFNIQAGTYQNVSNSFYWRRVVGTGTEVLSDGKTYDYVDLSATDCFTGTTIDGIDVTGFESVPQTGDQLVQMGNRTDASRQGFVTIEVRGENAPAFKVYKNVSGYSLDNKRKICLSPSLTDLKVNKLSIETEYEVARVPMQRADEWYTGMRCYYYDLVQHSGASWLCIYPEGGVDGVAYTTEEPSATATYWRVYASQGPQGIPGPTGPSAVGVTFNPESLIIEQNNEAPYNLKLENALVTLKIKEGDEDHSSGALITSVTPSTFEYQGATYNSCTCQTVLNTAVRITAIGTKGTTTVNGKTINNYVDQGYIDITVRYKGQNHTVRVYFYCNLLGTWQETVIGSTKTEVARSLSYAYTEEDPQDVKTLEQLGTFIKGSQDYEVNLQSKVLDANGNVIKTSGSLYKQTADAAELAITNKLGETGIKIDGNNREINLIAGKVNFKNADGSTANPKIVIDPTTGAMYLVDAKISGNAEIGGELKGATGTFKGAVNIADGKVLIDGNTISSVTSDAVQMHIGVNGFISKVANSLVNYLMATTSGIELRWGSDGIKLSTDGLQRYNGSTWVDMFAKPRAVVTSGPYALSRDIGIVVCTYRDHDMYEILLPADAQDGDQIFIRTTGFSVFVSANEGQTMYNPDYGDHSRQLNDQDCFWMTFVQGTWYSNYAEV